MTLRQVLTLILLLVVYLFFVLYNFGIVIPDSNKITWIK